MGSKGAMSSGGFSGVERRGDSHVPPSAALSERGCGKDEAGELQGQTTGALQGKQRNSGFILEGVGAPRKGCNHAVTR